MSDLKPSLLLSSLNVKKYCQQLFVLKLFLQYAEFEYVYTYGSYCLLFLRKPK